MLSEGLDKIETLSSRILTVERSRPSLGGHSQFLEVGYRGISAGRRHCRQVIVDVSFEEIGSAHQNSALSSTALV